MKAKRVPIDSVTQDPANVRRHDEKNLAAIVASLQRFGQQTPIVVDAANVVRKGNGTLLAARQLGWEHIDIVQTTLTGAEAIAYAIADNRTGDLGGWDDAALASQLKALAEDDQELFKATGFDLDFLDTLQDAEVSPPTEFGSYDETLETDYKCPACGHEWSGQPKPSEA